MKDKRKLIFSILLVLLVLANIGILSYYFANNREVQTGNSHISPDGNIIGYEQTSMNKEQVVLYQLALYDLKTGKTDFPFNKTILSGDQPVNLAGFGRQKSEVILTRGNVLSIFRKDDSGFEVIRMALEGSPEKNDGKETEQASGLLEYKGIRLGFRDITVNKPDRFSNLTTKKEINSHEIPDRISFGNSIVISFNEKPYYIIITENQPQMMKISESSLTPVPLNEKESENLKFLLPQGKTAYFYNPDEKYLTALINCDEDLNTFINNILGLPLKDRIVFIQDNKVLLYNLKRPGLEKEFSLDNKITEQKPYGSFRQQIVSKTENENILFIANGKEILEYNLDKNEENSIAKPGSGIIHHVDSSRDGSSLVAESNEGGQNSIFLVNRESGASRLLVKDRKIFINPAWYKASN